MNEKRYEVLIDSEVVAEGMELHTTIILVKALFEEYYNDSFTVSIRKIERCEVADANIATATKEGNAEC